MPTLNQIEMIEAREREIVEQISRLQEEATELAVTLKVLRRFANSAESSAAAHETAASQTDGGGDHEADGKLGPTRPNGCPTNYEMTDLILASAEKEGKDGLTIAEIVSEMSRRYWPGVKSAQVAASIYTMTRKGRFRKTPSGKFKRVKRVEEIVPNTAPERDASTWSS